MKRITVLLAEDHTIVREGFRKMLELEDDIEIVGEVADESQISETVRKTMPHFVVIALDQPGRRPLICDVLLREHPDVHVIAVAPEKNFIVYYWASLQIHSNDIEASEEGILSAMRNKLMANGAN